MNIMVRLDATDWQRPNAGAEAHLWQCVVLLACRDAFESPPPTSEPRNRHSIQTQARAWLLSGGEGSVQRLRGGSHG